MWVMFELDQPSPSPYTYTLTQSATNWNRFDLVEKRENKKTNLVQRQYFIPYACFPSTHTLYYYQLNTNTILMIFVRRSVSLFR